MKTLSDVRWMTGCLALAMVGCGSTDGAKSDGPDETGTSYQEFVAHDWSVEPGVEAYYCQYKTLTEDMYVSDFKPLMPGGTHHVTIGYQEPVYPDGFYNEGEQGCTGVSFGDVYSFVATVGTEEFHMPKGVAVKLPKGKQIVFGLHVLNSGTKTLTGRSGAQVISPAAAAVKDVAEVIAVNDIVLKVPPGKTTESSKCNVTDDGTYFAVVPHMHLFGTHMKTVATSPDGKATTLLDADYEFTEQKYKMLEPAFEAKKGTELRITCDYVNTGTNVMTFGESTTNGEMCITFAYRYPAVLDTSTHDNALPLSTCYDGP